MSLGPAIRAVLLLLLLWTMIGFFFGWDAALAGGSGLGLIVTVSVAAVAGQLLAFATGAPELLGALLAGLLLRNIPAPVDVGAWVDDSLASLLRACALVLILARAGLGLDMATLSRLGAAAARLALLPNVCEASLAAVILQSIWGMGWAWSFAGGFLLSAVSPAVVVPSVLRLQDQGLGTGQGVPTLVLAAASVDDVLSISGFGVALGIALGDAGLQGGEGEGGGGHGAAEVWRPVAELAAGLGFGLVGGALVAAVWHPGAGGSKSPQSQWAGLALFLLGCLAVLGGRAVELGGGGALAVLVLGVVAAAVWKGEDAVAFEAPQGEERPWWRPVVVLLRLGGECGGALLAACCGCCGCCGGGGVEGVDALDSAEPTVPTAAAAPSDSAEAGSAPRASPREGKGHALLRGTAAQLKRVWAVAQPVLFALIGAAVDVRGLSGELVAGAAAALAGGLALRGLLAFACVLGSGAGGDKLTAWESLFVAVAWMPKATVQAALGPVALDAVLGLVDDGDESSLPQEQQEALEAGRALLALAVLSILVTAPAGAALIAYTGPRLLRVDERVRMLQKGEEKEGVSGVDREAAEGGEVAAEAGAVQGGDADMQVERGGAQLV